MLKLKDQRQDGGINIIFKSFLSTTLFLLLNNVSASNIFDNGSIVLIPLEEMRNIKSFKYKNNLVTKVLKDNKPYLLFGIPYYSLPGISSFEFKSDGKNKIIDLSIRKKHFTTQNIKINKYSEKNKRRVREDLQRERRDQKCEKHKI